MRVFDDVERQMAVFGAVSYLEKAAARRQRRRTAVLTAVAGISGVAGTVALTAALLLTKDELSTGAAVAAASIATVPLLVGVGAYLAGLRALRLIDADVERFKPAPESLLGVVSPPK